MKNRLLSLLLCTVMLFALLPAGGLSVFAEEYDYTANEDLCVIFWYFSANDTEPTAGVDVPRGSLFEGPPRPARDDAIFIGWYTDRALTARFDPTEPITGNIELFAGWAIIDGFIPGDLNGDGEVNDQDAVYLLFHTFFPENYPVDQPVDYDIDNEVTDQDAVYLLFHTFFPGDYPI